MRYLIYFSLLIVFAQCGGTAALQEYRTHTVEKGETVYSISKKYGVPEQTIYSLNPDARNGIGTNHVLILPADAVVRQDNVTFKSHKVRRKETLFSISQLYNVQVEEIKKYNKDLYSRQLKKGERIQIPVYTTNTATSNNSSGKIDEPSNSEMGQHTVQPKETKFGIARKYGITVAELESLNPQLDETLRIGSVLNVPEDTVTDTAVIENDKFQLYEVQPKEGFFRLKVKFGLTQEEIVALNPYAKDGLKEGMILKLPKVDEIGLTDEIRVTNLENNIVNRSKKRIAVMLPFQLNRADADTLENNKDLIRNNGALRVALDFYSGALMAAEFAKERGISIELNIYDTQGNENTVRDIIARNNFENVDAVIGPLLQKNVERAANELKKDGIPIFSPLSNRDIKISSNVFQTIPTDKMLEEAMIDYLAEHSVNKNIVLICDAKKAAQKSALMEAIPGAKSVALRDKSFLHVKDIADIISEFSENWFVLESDDPVIVSNVVGLLNGMPEKFKIRLFTLDKNDAFDYHDVSNVRLANLGFTFPSVNKRFNHDDKNAFLVSYKNKYGVLPNRFAVRGFDVTYDVLLRLATADDIYEAHDSSIETEYVENKFRYSKKLFSGYQNNAFYIIRYNKDLEFEVVE